MESYSEGFPEVSLNWTAVPAGSPMPGPQERAGTLAPSHGTDTGARSVVERFLIQERQRHLVSLLHRHGFMPLSGHRILEVGCGTGKWLRELIALGADPAKVVGVELLPSSAARARRLCPAPVTIECSNAANLKFPSESFDIVLQATVFSGVLDSDMRDAIAAEMLRVVRPAGLILWYDLIVENPWNSCVHPLRKSDVRRMFPGCSLELRRVGLTPLIAQLLVPRSWRASSILSSASPLCTHYLGAIRPPWNHP
ncbi:MAG TPA: class I SAM-dependent methyltransferase [Gemmatimonadales bacterium]|nr:class I SAM-dependent methyltransferase [Gemmatimonadales bacterium]